MAAVKQRSPRDRPGRPGSRRSSRPGSGTVPHEPHRFAIPGGAVMLALAMLGACLVLGGGGTSNPATEIVLELLLPILLVAAIWWPQRRQGADTAHPVHGTSPQIGPIPPTALALVLLVLLIPVAQLIPLPPTIWHALPGRQPEVSALSLIGHADHWMPFTLTPARTFASLLAIVAMLAFFLAAAQIGVSGRLALCVVITGIGLLSIVLGALQISLPGGYSWSLYGDPSEGWILGFQANRNAETDVLQIAALAVAALLAGGAQRFAVRGMHVAAAGIVMVALALGTVLTGSRTGIALLPLTYLFVVWIVWPVLSRRLSFLSWWTALIPPIAGLALAMTSPVQHALSRFDMSGERRWDIWHDAITAIRSVWPLGGGIGSFPVIYDASQSIERLAPELDLRAHNDWLEWVLEAGVPGIIVLLAIGLVLLACNARALRAALRRGADAEYRATVLFATGTLLHIGLHGLVDYPMRSMALVALASAAAAMIMPPCTSSP